MRRKIDMLNTKWYSTNCFIKYYSKNGERKETGLTCLSKLDKNELVATFPLNKTIKPDMHFIRHNEIPTCYLEKHKVFTLHQVEALTELTLNFNLILN